MASSRTVAVAKAGGGILAQGINILDNRIIMLIINRDGIYLDYEIKCL